MNKIVSQVTKELPKKKRRRTKLNSFFFKLRLGQKKVGSKMERGEEELRSSARRDDRIDTQMMTLMPFQLSIFNTTIALSHIVSCRVVLSHIKSYQLSIFNTTLYCVMLCSIESYQVSIFNTTFILSHIALSRIK